MKMKISKTNVQFLTEGKKVAVVKWSRAFGILQALVPEGEKNTLQALSSVIQHYNEEIGGVDLMERNNP